MEKRQNGSVANGKTPSVANAAPKGFVPFSSHDITPEIVAYAAKNLNETPETVAKGIRELREKIKSDKDIAFIDEEWFFLVFLRSRKFDVKRSADLFYAGLNYVENYRDMLEREDPEVIRRVIDSNMIGFLPYRDPKGRAIIYARADAWDPQHIKANDAIFGGVMAVQSAGHNPVNQILGFLVLLDLKDLKINQVLAMSRWLIFGTITLQRACPCFLKAFHVINVPSIYKIGWKLVKPLLSEKIKNRFIFHKSSDLSTLYEHIPKDILPPELGGSVPFSNDHWSWDLERIEKRYHDQLNSCGRISKMKKKSLLKTRSLSSDSLFEEERIQELLKETGEVF